MAQEWGHSIETITMTEYKASQADNKTKEINDLSSQVKDMQKQIEKLQFDNARQKAKISEQERLQEEQFEFINKFIAKSGTDADQSKNESIVELDQALEALYYKYNVKNHLKVPGKEYPVEVETSVEDVVPMAAKITKSKREIENHDDV